MPRLRRSRALLLLCAPASLAGCDVPTFSSSKRMVIAVDARALLRYWPTNDSVVVPNDRLPPTIAGLDPDLVMVRADGVDIVTTASSDGGWGYYVPRSAHPSSAILFRHRSLGHGVYWFDPN